MAQAQKFQRRQSIHSEDLLIGLVVSIVLHLVLFIGANYWLRNLPNQKRELPEPISIEFIEVPTQETPPKETNLRAAKDSVAGGEAKPEQPISVAKSTPPAAPRTSSTNSLATKPAKSAVPKSVQSTAVLPEPQVTQPQPQPQPPEPEVTQPQPQPQPPEPEVTQQQRTIVKRLLEQPEPEVTQPQPPEPEVTQPQPPEPEVTQQQRTIVKRLLEQPEPKVTQPQPQPPKTTPEPTISQQQRTIVKRLLEQPEPKVTQPQPQPQPKTTVEPKVTQPQPQPQRTIAKRLLEQQSKPTISQPQPQPQTTKAESKTAQPQPKPQKTAVASTNTKPKVSTSQEKKKLLPQKPVSQQLATGTVPKTQPQPKQSQSSGAASRLGGPVALSSRNLGSDNLAALPNSNRFNSGAEGIDASQEADIDAYLEQLRQRVSQQWIPGLTPYSRQTVLFFVVSRSGQINDLRVVQPSGSSVTDEAALGAIKRAAPFAPLPTNYSDNYINIRFSFNINIYGELELRGIP